MKAKFLPLFNVNLYQPQLTLNSISTKLQFNLISTSLQLQPKINLSININLNSTLILTSTQYGCDIKATQSCVFIVNGDETFKWKHLGRFLADSLGALKQYLNLNSTLDIPSIFFVFVKPVVTTTTVRGLT